MAVLAVLGVVVAWRYAVKGKGNGAARLAALLCAVIVVWVLVAMQDPKSANIVADGFVTGINGAVSGLASFLSHF